MIALLLQNWKLAAIAALVALLGLQSWRLDHLQGVHALTLKDLENAQHDRDQAIATVNDTRNALKRITAEFDEYTAQHALEENRARNEADAALARQRELETALQAARNETHEVFNSPECDDIRGLPICADLDRVLRQSRAAHTDPD